MPVYRWLRLSCKSDFAAQPAADEEAAKRSTSPRPQITTQSALERRKFSRETEPWRAREGTTRGRLALAGRGGGDKSTGSTRPELVSFNPYGCVRCLGTDYAAGRYELDRAIPPSRAGQWIAISTRWPWGNRFVVVNRTPPLLMFKAFPTEPLLAGRDSTKRYRISWATGKRLVTRRWATPKTALLTLSPSMRTTLIMIPVE